MKSPRNDRPWQNRRRGFDDDGFFGNTPSPPTFPAFASTAPEVQGTVKWFNAEKGYGFVAMSDGSGDVFLHANALQAAGYQTVGSGATLRVRVGQGQKGRQIEQVVSVDESTAEPSAPRRSGGGGGMGRGRSGFGGGGGGEGRRPDMSTAVEMSGTVKWYNPDKGFGFITPQGGGKDVFIHARVLERAGLAPLREGQTVRMSVVQGMKGPEAGAISED